MKNLKARIVPLLGIIVMVTIIGFTLAGCGEKGSDDFIDWVGTWKLEGGKAEDTFTLGANGGDWSVGWDTESPTDISNKKWEAGLDEVTGWTELLLQGIPAYDTRIVSIHYLVYERISSTEIRTSGGNPAYFGTWKKQ